MCAQSCPILCDPVDCSPPGSSVHGVFQEWILEWVAISFSRGYCRPRDRTLISCISYFGRRILYHQRHCLMDTTIDFSLWSFLEAVFQIAWAFTVFLTLRGLNIGIRNSVPRTCGNCTRKAWIIFPASWFYSKIKIKKNSHFNHYFLHKSTCEYGRKCGSIEYLRWKTRLQGHSKYSVAAGVTGIFLYVTVGLLRFSFFFFFSIYLLIYLAGLIYFYRS